MSLLDLCPSRIRARLAALVVLLAATAPLPAQMGPDQAANLLLTGARRAYNEKNYPFAAARFREFLARFGGHKEVPAARYGLALALIDGPTRDYPGALEALQPLAGNKGMPEHPWVLYYLGLAQRGLGVRAQGLAAQKPNEASQHQASARQRFEEADKHFAAALAAFSTRASERKPEDGEQATLLEWAARCRCDQAEMLLRLHKAREARAAAAPFLEDRTLGKSRYRVLGLYYHGFACFLLGDQHSAGRSLGLLAPFDDPVFGTHARYLLARVHHADQERQEAQALYEEVITEHARQKQAAAEALRQPDRFKNDPEEKARLEALVKGAPDHVARATFFLGVMRYEDGRFAEALGQLSDFAQQFPTSPLTSEAQLRRGFCQVQLKQFAEAQKVLQPLADKDPLLAEQALLWLAKAQAGTADPARPETFRPALESFRKAADRVQKQAAVKPGAARIPTQKGEILLELADTQQLARQYREAATTYNQVLDEKFLPARQEEVLEHLIAALQLTGAYVECDRACQRFLTAHKKSTLTPSVLFRSAENAYFQALAAEKLPTPADRTRESARWMDEALRRYQEVEKYPEFAYVNLARYGLGMAYYRKGDLDRAQEKLASIPQAERTGDLAIVPYQLADILIRQAPARADDAVAAGKLEEQLKGALELLEGYVASQPNGPRTADALLKLGYCQQRLAGLVAEPAEKAKTLASARSAYEQVLQRFPQSPAQPQAQFKRAKCLAQAGQVDQAAHELRRFATPPLATAPVAPMALLHLATLLRGQNKVAEAADVLANCRKQHEPALLQDPQRAGWVVLLQYHHAVALREVGRRSEARALFEQVARQGADRPEAWEAVLRAGQCLKEEAEKKVADARKQRSQPGLAPQARANTERLLAEGTLELNEGVRYLSAQADALKDARANGEEQERLLSQARARMLYEAAWGTRVLAEMEVEAAREKMRNELWQKRRDEVVRQVPPGAQPFVPAPEVPLEAIPLQPAEKLARSRYQTLIEAFPDLAINADAQFELAELLGERGEHEAAIKLLRDALDKEPPPELTDKIRVRLGAALQAKGDRTQALAQFQAVTRNPKSPVLAHALYREAECQLALGQPAEAVKRLTMFRDRGEFQNLPGLTDRALLRLGYAQALLKQWDASRQAYEQVTARFGHSPLVHEARYGIAWAHQNQGRYDEAVNVYNMVTGAVLTELAARAQLNIGLCRLAQKRYPDASTALLVVPFTYDYPRVSALALIEAARAFAENKQEAQAIKLLERVLRDHPDTEPARAARKRLEELKKS